MYEVRQGGDVGVVFAAELGVADVGAAGPDLVAVDDEELVVHDVAVAAADVAMHASRRERADEGRRIGISECGAVGVLAVDHAAHDDAAMLSGGERGDDVRLGAHPVDGKIDRLLGAADGGEQFAANGALAGRLGAAVLVGGELDGVGECLARIAGRAVAGCRAPCGAWAGPGWAHAGPRTRRARRGMATP